MNNDEFHYKLGQTDTQTHTRTPLKHLHTHTVDHTTPGTCSASTQRRAGNIILNDEYDSFDHGTILPKSYIFSTLPIDFWKYSCDT